MNEQTLRDAIELLTLSSETMTDTYDRLQQVDQVINQTGHQVVKLHEKAVSLEEKVESAQKEQLENVERINTQTDNLLSIGEDISKGIGEQRAYVDEQQEAFEQILKHVQENKQAQEDNQSELTEQIGKMRTSYESRQDELQKAMTEMNDLLNTNEIESKIDHAVEHLNDSLSRLSELHNKRESQEEARTERLNNLTTQFQDVVVRLGALEESTEETSDRLNLLLSKMNAVSFAVGETTHMEWEDDKTTGSHTEEE